jgi:cyclopropane fatty-acyl-phospholipid synthase-like methyltransferase/DUF1365 family protein
VRPAVYDVDIRHARAEPVRHDLRHRSRLWFVDLDDLPRSRWLRFEARDHVGDPAATLRANLDAYLGEQGIDLAGGRITMLTQPRSLGYVFNPLTLYWCHGADGELMSVVAEVHNTYGERHRYLLRTDDAGRAETVKEFYVSPFFPVDGSYRMSVPEPGDRLAVTITLHRPGARPFTASVRGARRSATRRALVAAALVQPLAGRRVRALITWHGVRLWRKGLTVQPRPSTPVGPYHPEVPVSAAHRVASLVRATTGLEPPVRVQAWDGSQAGPADGPLLVIRSRRALRRLLWAPGELGLARAYVTGDIDVEGDLAEAFRRVWRLAGARPANARPSAGARLRVALGAARLGALGRPPAAPASEARLSGRRHTQLRDRAAVAHHYDLSNEFYELLLDETMAYSSAYFTSPDQSLAQAQRAKLDLICRKLELQPGQRLLDVGCGWGSLILHAAEHYGVHATGVTLSVRQRDFVAKRVADRGLADRVEVRLQDYRDVTGRFDAVSSVEMGEHVGEEQYPSYAGRLFAAVRPGGRLLLQQMSRAAGGAPGGGAFIEAYIAPDMHMRPMSQTLAHLETAGFEVRGVEALREHYVPTVQRWIDTVEARWDDFVALVGEEVARGWRLYLVGGALAFEQNRMGVDQFLAVRPAP